MRRFLCFSVSVPAALVLLIGCGGSGGRKPITGMITFQKQPLDQGRIEFHPDGGEATMAGAVIEKGKYEIPAGKGLMPGTYKVAIYSSTAAPSTDQLPGEPPVYKERIPAKYNEATTLKAEIKDGGPSQFNFELN